MATTQWKKPKSGAWEDSKNWSEGRPHSGDVVQIVAKGDYTVTLSSKAELDELDLSYATLVEQANASLSTDKIMLSQARLELDAANRGLTGEIDVDRSTLVIGHKGALGSATINIGYEAAVLDSKISTTISNEIDCYTFPDRLPLFEAEAGHKLTIAGVVHLNGGAIQVGSKRATGEVSFAPQPTQTHEHVSVHIAGGALSLGNADGRDFLSGLITIDKDARLDLHGFSFGPVSLDDEGAIVNSGATCTLAGDKLSGAGRVSGAILVDFGYDASTSPIMNAFALTGSGGFTMQHDAQIILGSSVSVAAGGHVSVIGHSLTLQGAATIAGSIDGSGNVIVDSGSTVELSGDSSAYQGSLEIERGSCILDDGAALGSPGLFVSGGGILSLDVTASILGGIDFGYQFDYAAGGGTLVEREDATLANTITYYNGGGAIASATGHVFTLTGSVNLEFGGGVILFGVAGDDGTVVLAPSTMNLNGHAGDFGVDVTAGTLQIGSNTGNLELGDSGHVVVDIAATLDLHGYNATAALLSGAGTITTTGGGSLTDYGGIFSGAITGDLAIYTAGDITLSGPCSFSTLAIESGSTITLGGSASEHVVMTDDPGVTLALTASASLTGSVEGFSNSDHIDLQGLAFQASGGGHTTASYNPSNHHLTVTTAGQSIVLTIDGTHATADFTVSDDGQGHTLVGLAGPKAAPASPHEQVTNNLEAVFGTRETFPQLDQQLTTSGQHELHLLHLAIA